MGRVNTGEGQRLKGPQDLRPGYTVFIHPDPHFHVTFPLRVWLWGPALIFEHGFHILIIPSSHNIMALTLQKREGTCTLTDSYRFASCICVSWVKSLRVWNKSRLGILSGWLVWRWCIWQPRDGRWWLGLSTHFLSASKPLVCSIIFFIFKCLTAY